MIEKLLVLFGLCAFLNGTFTFFKKYTLLELVIRLLITGGFVSMIYGIVLFF